MCSDLVIFACMISHSPQNVNTPSVTKSPQSRCKNPPSPHKYPQGLDKFSQASYSVSHTPTERTYVSCISASAEAAL